MKSRLFLLLPAIVVIYWKSCEGHCASNPCRYGGTCVLTVPLSSNGHRCQCPANSTGPHCGAINWSRKKPATCSVSLTWAQNAVDGKHTSSVTGKHKYSWWRVDLQIVIEVVEIAIHMAGFFKAGESNVVVGIYDGVYKVCGAQRIWPQPSSRQLLRCSSGVRGNLVVFANRGSGEWRIALIDFSVYGSPLLRDQCLSNPCDNGGTCQPSGTFYKCTCPTGWLGSYCEGTNWALLKKANMSSVQANKYRPSNAVDGRTDDMMRFGSDYRCVYSRKEYNPYLEIDLEKELEIRKVVIVNRQDCCSSFLDNFDIVIGSYDGGTNKTCGAPQNNMSHIARKSIYCSSGVIGRIVTITLRGRQHLTLCEVQVYGYLLPCLSNPCSNAATCQRIAEGLFYECLCSTFFSGPYCENVSPCRSYPCENGGTCGSNKNETFYNCVCAAKWTGPNCEYLVSCLSNPCENGGTCGRNENEIFYNCVCAANWTGPNCEYLFPCLSTPCENGGTCGSNKNEMLYFCVCAANWTGSNCEYLFPCLSNPCENGGTCAHKENIYNCTCPSTWTGSNCEQKQEERKTMSMTTKALIGVGVASAVVAGAAVASGTAGSVFGVITRNAGEIMARLGATAIGKYIRLICFYSSDDDDDEDEEEEEEMDDDDDEEEEPQWALSADSLFSMMTFPW